MHFNCYFSLSRSRSLSDIVSQYYIVYYLELVLVLIPTPLLSNPSVLHRFHFFHLHCLYCPIFVGHCLVYTAFIPPSPPSFFLKVRSFASKRTPTG